MHPAPPQSKSAPPQFKSVPAAPPQTGLVVSGALPIDKGIRLRQITTPEEQDRKLKEVSEMYEKHFLRELVKSMRTTVPESGLIKVSQAEKIFQEQRDEQYVEKWSERGGIGLANMIHEQLLQRYGEDLGLRDRAVRPRGPLALTEGRQIGFQMQKTQRELLEAPPRTVDPQFSDIGSVRLTFKNLDGAATAVTSPWDGILSQAQLNQGNGKIRLAVDHGGGLKSVLRFQGKLSDQLMKTLSSVAAGDPIGLRFPLVAGQELGLWSSASPAMEWDVRRE